ncbi:MAG: pantetheine-phosphate adenylyltransferase [Firmicutes bacterium]|nr:pantetheine-phosphate adenylyltransferase [Bacillota bacterium]
MRVAVFPGSFDPITNGHLNMIERASKLFDRLFVAVFVNAQKQPRFSVAQRVDFIRESVRHLPQVEVDQFSGLVVDYLKQRQCTVLVRGLRTSTDFESEWQLAAMNHALHADVETVLLPSWGEHLQISSSLIKDIASHGGDITPFVPPVVLQGFLSS